VERTRQFQRRHARTRRHHRFRCAGGRRFKTVTVSGDYVGNGGQWIFNRALGDDTSLGDQLVINGNSSGTASVSVRNAGGAGALTQEGIRLITVAGQSDAQFSLQGRAVAGAYDYFLFKGGVSTPDDGNWYLRSEYVPPVEPGSRSTRRSRRIRRSSRSRRNRRSTHRHRRNRRSIRHRRSRRSIRRRRNRRSIRRARRWNARNRRPTWPTAAPRWACSGTACTTAPVIPPPGQRSGDAVAWMHLRSAQPDSHDRNRQVQVDGQISSVLVGVGRRFEWVVRASCRPVRCSAGRAMTAARR
jgi:autotransporter family porin